MQTTQNPDGSIKHNVPLQLSPAVLAKSRTVDSSISSSTEVALDPATTIIRVYAVAKDIYMKWGADDVSASNFDEVIPAGQICDFLVPGAVNGAKITAVNFIEREASATLILIQK